MNTTAHTTPRYTRARGVIDRSPLPFTTYAPTEWVVSGSVPLFDSDEPYTLSAFRPSTHPDGGWDLATGRTPARHEEDGLVFDCAGDADWHKRTVGLLHPFNPYTEGE